MAHPSRSKFFPYLRKKLGKVPFAIDKGYGIWENAKKAWGLHKSDSDYHIVIQDDAIIGKDFLKNAKEHLKKYPNHAHCFYYGKRKNEKIMNAAKKGIKNGGVEMDKLNWGVAVCLPKKIIPGMLKFCDSLKILHNHDDSRISQYLQKISMKIWYPLPSLIDHRWDEKSLMGNCEGVKKRQAFKFIGE